MVNSLLGLKVCETPPRIAPKLVKNYGVADDPKIAENSTLGGFFWVWWLRGGVAHDGRGKATWPARKPGNPLPLHKRIIRYTVHSTQYTVHSTQYTVHSTQYTVHSTQYTVHSTQYTVHSTQYSTWSISGQNTFFFAKIALIFYAFLLEKTLSCIFGRYFGDWLGSGVPHFPSL